MKVCVYWLPIGGEFGLESRSNLNIKLSLALDSELWTRSIGDSRPLADCGDEPHQDLTRMTSRNVLILTKGICVRCAASVDTTERQNAWSSNGRTYWHGKFGPYGIDKSPPIKPAESSSRSQKYEAFGFIAIWYIGLFFGIKSLDMR